MNDPDPSLSHFGDAALLVTFDERIDPRINARVHALAAAVARERRQGVPWLAPIPGYASLLVPYDPLRMAADDAQAALAAIVQAPETTDTVDYAGPQIEIPVRYGGDEGPDLTTVADRLGLSPARVVELHCSVEYRAYLLGFAPGFAYLGVLPPQLELPRRNSPRPRVPAGSVAIAGRQAAVYPLATPGGWHIIGRTELPLWDAARAQPALIAAGARVRFVARA